MQRNIAATRLFICLVLLSGVHGANAQANASPCNAPDFHQFDFWLGDWDAYDASSAKPTARVIVTRALDGCALREDYRQPGMQGESLNMYDPVRRLWTQSWFTTRGEQILLQGEMRGSTMHLEAGQQTAKGPVRIRGDWTPAHGGVHETADRSTDGGKKWTEWYDMMLKPHGR